MIARTGGDALALSPADTAYIFHSPAKAREAWRAIESGGYEERMGIVWVKHHFVIGHGHYHSRHECVIYAVRHGADARWVGGRNQDSVWRVDGVQSPRAPAHDRFGSDHPTQKPVALYERAMKNHAHEGVIDLFAGSGTIYIAAERRGRTAFGVEIDPGYASMAIERWERQFGKRAELLDRRAA